MNEIIKNPKLYYVEWQDAHSAGGWHNSAELEKFVNRDRCICEETGWIVSETKDEIVMACRKLKWVADGDPEYGMLQKIPRTWIRKKQLVYLSKKG